MIKEEKFILLIADSTHLVMKCEGILKDNHIKCRILPLPGELKASCGLSIKIEEEDLERVKAKLQEEVLKLEGYLVKKEGIRKKYEKLF